MIDHTSNPEQQGWLSLVIAARVEEDGGDDINPKKQDWTTLVIAAHEEGGGGNGITEVAVEAAAADATSAEEHALKSDRAVSNGFAGLPFLSYCACG